MISPEDRSPGPARTTWSGWFPRSATGQAGCGFGSDWFVNRTTDEQRFARR